MLSRPHAGQMESILDPGHALVAATRGVTGVLDRHVHLPRLRVQRQAVGVPLKVHGLEQMAGAGIDDRDIARITVKHVEAVALGIQQQGHRLRADGNVAGDLPVGRVDGHHLVALAARRLFVPWEEVP